MVRVTPAEGPSFGVAPSGTWIWMSCFAAFLHDVAEGSGELDGSLALHDGGLNGQNLSAGLGPGKAVAHAGTQRHAVLVIEEDRRTEQFEKVIGLHLKGRLFSLCLAARHLAAKGAEGALQRTDAGLTRVLPDDLFYGFVRDGHVSGFKSVLLHALGEEVPFGDFELFLLCVARQLDDLHAVPEGRGNGIQCVGRAQEEHLREIEGHAQVMI